MPLVTRLAGRRDRVRVFVDGEFWAELDAGVAAERGLSEGTVLSDEELSGARVAGERPLAMSRALNVLGYRARSARELRERLLRAGYLGETVDEVISRLEELGYLNDEEFARELVRSEARKYGPRRIYGDLRRAGIEEEAAREKVRRAEEERQRAEAERKAVAAFQKAAPEIARDLQIASSRAAQKRWEDAESALSKAEQALSAFRGTNIQQSERCAELLAQLERLRPDVNAGVQQLEEKREEQERKRQEMKEAAEERRQASLRVQCCDGTLSPSCLCDRPSKRGCCSHHGGVCGCED